MGATLHVSDNSMYHQGATLHVSDNSIYHQMRSETSSVVPTQYSRAE
jgi:hypothetical protein